MIVGAERNKSQSIGYSGDVNKTFYLWYLRYTFTQTLWSTTLSESLLQKLLLRIIFYITISIKINDLHSGSSRI